MRGFGLVSKPVSLKLFGERFSSRLIVPVNDGVSVQFHRPPYA